MRLIILCLLFGCETGKTTIDISEPSIEAFVDSDGDGYLSDEDCDDNDGLIYPGAEEVCDGTDNNCDGQVDEGVSNPFYLDQDGDGFGVSDEMIEACDAPEGYVPNDNDCDDTNEAVYPSANEICDGIDNDCNEEIDENSSGVWYADLDGDGFGDLETMITGCQPDSSWVQDNTDCDDLDGLIHPEMEEVCDEIDNNCDGEIDEGVLISYYLDVDGDGFGDPNAITEDCFPAENMVTNDLDCDDINPLVNPNADEVCSDDIDNNCDGIINEDTAIDALLWYQDTDQDGYGTSNQTTYSCELPVGYADNSDDCNDYNSLQYPDAAEYCNSIDDDCDGSTDENSPLGSTAYYSDLDQDGFGDPNSTVLACSLPSGLVSNSDDCDDSDPSIYPNAPELCDGILNDCNTPTLPLNEADQDGDGISECAGDCDDLEADYQVPQDWYADLDGDGFGDANNSVLSCLPQAGFVSDQTDCDDVEATVYPNAPEICDGIINDCNTSVLPSDELDGDGDGVSECAGDCDDTNPDYQLVQNWYHDSDLDGYGNVNVPFSACIPPAGYTLDSSDCDDSSPEYNIIRDWYFDSDLDGFGDANTFFNSCSPPAGHLSDNTDCDDLDDTIYPNAPELCDGQVNACQGVLGASELDGDGDGYVPCTLDSGGWDGDPTILGAGDCDDADPNTHPYAGFQEVDAFECMTDVDGDGFGTSTPSGSAIAGTDCDDTDATWAPIAGLCPVGESCYEVLLNYPGVPSDDYIIDPDGLGGLDPFEVYCDMTTDGGGWTKIAYASDLQFTRHFFSGDAWNWLPSDFSYELTDAQIDAIQAVSIEGYQEYVGLCNGVIHYVSGSNYDYAFGFEFFDGTQITGAYGTVNSPLISILQDGCAQNGGEGGSLTLATIFAFDTPLVPIRNVRCRDCGDGSEQFGSPLTNNPAWLR